MMSNSRFIVSLAVLLIATVVGAQDELESRIVGGNEVTDDIAPYIVSIWVGDVFACGGSIVKPSTRTIVTAAHCVDLYTADRITVGVGAISLWDQLKHKVESIKLHPGYIFYDQNDIALLYLDEDLVFDSKVSPIPLETQSISPKDSVTIYGWGKTSHPGISTSELRTIDVTTISMESCKLYWQRLSNNHLCTVKWPKLGGACKGDSGGPLVRGNKLIGILSWGYGQCGTGYPDVFTRISPYVKWINQNIR